ncbi:MAG TPA: hypothetical protein VK578_10880 [Edaphobacter sp.]|nr:hypothetical protein [Edaphobacter sp.]
MSLASELSGDDALARVQSRVQAYWDRQWERRLIASLRGVLLSNVANNAADMVNDISGAAGAAANFSAEAVIDTVSRRTIFASSLPSPAISSCILVPFQIVFSFAYVITRVPGRAKRANSRIQSQQGRD